MRHLTYVAGIRPTTDRVPETSASKSGTDLDCFRRTAGLRGGYLTRCSRPDSSGAGLTQAERTPRRGAELISARPGVRWLPYLYTPLVHKKGIPGGHRFGWSCPAFTDGWFLGLMVSDMVPFLPRHSSERGNVHHRRCEQPGEVQSASVAPALHLRFRAFRRSCPAASTTPSTSRSTLSPA